MTTKLLPLSEVTERATDILIKEMGVVDTMRFLNQYRTGAGNYTTDREQMFEGMSVKDIVTEIKAQRKADDQSV